MTAELRHNDELEAAMNGSELPRRSPRRSPTRKLQTDLARRRAFKVLSVIADLSQSQRTDVLKQALKISRGK